MTEYSPKQIDTLPESDVLVGLSDAAVNPNMIYTLQRDSANPEKETAEVILVPAHIEGDAQKITIEPGGSSDVQTSLVFYMPYPSDPNKTACALVEEIPGSGLLPRAVVFDIGFDTHEGPTLHVENTTDQPIEIAEGDFFTTLRVVEVFDPAKFSDYDYGRLPNLTEQGHESIVLSVTPEAAANGLDLERIHPDSTKRHMGDAGLDVQLNSSQPLTLAPGENAHLATGLILLSGTEVMPQPRTGLGRRGLMPEQIEFVDREDGYKEAYVLVTNRGKEPITLQPADRFAQFLFPDSNSGSPTITGKHLSTDIPKPASTRGNQGYGSTGQ